MKFTLVLFVALGMTMAWQASVVAKSQPELTTQNVTPDNTAKVAVTRE